jgi:hypothetical protein
MCSYRPWPFRLSGRGYRMAVMDGACLVATTKSKPDEP